MPRRARSPGASYAAVNIEPPAVVTALSGSLCGSGAATIDFAKPTTAIRAANQLFFIS